MPESDKQLCSRNFLDGLFLGVPAAQRDEAAALCRKHGYDPAHPHAFYPAEVAVVIAKGLGALLLPAGTLAEQQHSLGKMMVEGYGQTIPGRLAVAGQRGVRLLKERLSHYMPLLTHEFPSAWQELSVADDDTYIVRVVGFPLHPAFIQGALLRVLELEGYVPKSCSYREAQEHEVYYTISAR